MVHLVAAPTDTAETALSPPTAQLQASHAHVPWGSGRWPRKPERGAFARLPAELAEISQGSNFEVVEGEVTKPETLRGHSHSCC